MFPVEMKLVIFYSRLICIVIISSRLRSWQKSQLSRQLIDLFIHSFLKALLRCEMFRTTCPATMSPKRCEKKVARNILQCNSTFKSAYIHI